MIEELIGWRTPRQADRRAFCLHGANSVVHLGVTAWPRVVYHLLRHCGWGRTEKGIKRCLLLSVISKRAS